MPRSAASDRPVADDGHPWRGVTRFEVDLQRAAAEAGVVRHHLAGLRWLVRGADPQHDGFARVEHGERLGTHRGLGALAADEALHRPVGEDERLVARPGTGRSLGQHHPCMHERHPPRRQLGGPLTDP